MKFQSDSVFPGRRALPVSMHSGRRAVKTMKGTFVYRHAGPTDLKSCFFKRDFAAANEHRRFTVARGPSDAIRASERVPPAIVAWRGTGPRPTVSEVILATVARGPVPRDVERFMKHPHFILIPDFCQVFPDNHHISPKTRYIPKSSALYVSTIASKTASGISSSCAANSSSTFTMRL